MTDQAYNPTNYCYRHPDRQSFVLCQRCGRTICPECQTPAAVGVHCPECVREQRAAFSANRRSSGAPSRLTVAGRRFAMLDQKATVVLVGLSVVVWLLDQVTGGRLISNALLYAPPYLPTQPWRLVTSLFVHGSIFHIAFNMWALWVFGRMLENMLGTWRFLALYFISGVAGGLAVTWLAPYTAVIGASGAIFGLFAAFFVLQRSLGNNAVQLLVIMGLNLAIGFIPGVGIAWQAHLGGIVAGFVVGFVFTRTRNIRQRGLQITLLSVVAVAVVVLTYVGYAVRLG